MEWVAPANHRPNSRKILYKLCVRVWSAEPSDLTGSGATIMGLSAVLARFVCTQTTWLVNETRMGGDNSYPAVGKGVCIPHDVTSRATSC
jgi:hypothetical protein